MKITMFNILFEVATLGSATEQIVSVAYEKKKGLVVTPNVDHVVMLQRDDDMLRIYRDALFRYADGMPLVWLSRILSAQHLPERVTGADLLPSICRSVAGTVLNLYFLGGNPGVAESAAVKLREQFPGVTIVGSYCPPLGFEYDQDETDRIIRDINALNVHILFIGVGAPKQEKWADANLGRLDVGPIMCVGAAFDFAAGIQMRAPITIQKCGLEWLWRFLNDPLRLWRRYLLRDSFFIFLAAKEIYTTYKLRKI